MMNKINKKGDKRGKTYGEYRKEIENRKIRKDLEEFLIFNSLDDLVDFTEISASTIYKFRKGKNLNWTYLERLQAYLYVNMIVESK